MHGSIVERIGRVGDPQKSGALDKCCRSETRNLQQFFAATEPTVRVAPCDDVFGDRALDTGDVAQQFHRSGVQVDPDMVDRRFHHAIQCLQQFFLVHIVLVLADADRFRFDFDQLGQRVLDPTGDRYRAAQRYVEIRQFVFGQFGGGVNRSAGFIGNDVMQRQFVVADQTGKKFFRFVRSSAVADRSKTDLVATDQLQHLLGCRLALRLAVRQVENGGRQHGSLRVDDGCLAAGAVTRVEAEHGVTGQRRNQQQLAQVAAK